MGQIFNRIFDIAKANRNSKKVQDSFIEKEDGELKRIINELNKDNKKSEPKDDGFQTVEIIHIEKALSILKLTRNASDEDIKKAYIERIKEYHPDRLENFGDDLKELAKIRTQEINEAYWFIMNQREK